MSPAEKLLRTALSCDALVFGDFTLKSGRPSPYFMNIGKLTSASAAAALGRLYATRVCELAPQGALLLGLPYKGIPLAALACAHIPDILEVEDPPYAYAYLRKEAKDHGEGGLLVGNKPVAQQPAILIDDVLTAGTAVRDALATLAQLGIAPVGLVVAFDREERASSGSELARDTLANTHGLPVSSIATASDLLAVASAEQGELVRRHLSAYGASERK